MSLLLEVKLWLESDDSRDLHGLSLPPAGHKRDLLFDDSIVVSLSSSRSPLMALTAWATKKMKKATSLS